MMRILLLILLLFGTAPAYSQKQFVLRNFQKFIDNVKDADNSNIDSFINEVSASFIKQGYIKESTSNNNRHIDFRKTFRSRQYKSLTFSIDEIEGQWICFWFCYPAKRYLLSEEDVTKKLGRYYGRTCSNDTLWAVGKGLLNIDNSVNTSGAFYYPRINNKQPVVQMDDWIMFPVKDSILKVLSNNKYFYRNPVYSNRYNVDRIGLIDRNEYIDYLQKLLDTVNYCRDECRLHYNDSLNLFITRKSGLQEAYIDLPESNYNMSGFSTIDFRVYVKDTISFEKIASTFAPFIDSQKVFKDIFYRYNYLWKNYNAMNEELKYLENYPWHMRRLSSYVFNYDSYSVKIEAGWTIKQLMYSISIASECYLSENGAGRTTW